MPRSQSYSRQGQRVPFKKLCYHAGRDYLVIIDCYSDWLTIAPMGTEVTSLNVVSAFRALFSQTAISDVLWSDGRPQFTAKYFQSFADGWGFFHHKSTPHYPQGNGQAESAVKSTKSGMKRQKFRWGETQQSPPPISQHSMSKRCFITCPKAVWVTGSTADHLLHNGSILQKMQNSRQQVRGMLPRSNTMHQLGVYRKFKWGLM